MIVVELAELVRLDCETLLRDNFCRARLSLSLAEGGRGGTCGAGQFVRGNYESFKGINLTVLGRMHQFIMGGGGGTGGAIMEPL